MASSFFEPGKGVRILTPESFDTQSVMKIPDMDCGLVLFYASWCPYCISIKDTWAKLGKTVGFMDIAAFECDMFKNHTQGMREDYPDYITSYPTLVLYKDQLPVRKLLQHEREYITLLNIATHACRQ